MTSNDKYKSYSYQLGKQYLNTMVLPNAAIDAPAFLEGLADICTKQAIKLREAYLYDLLTGANRTDI